LDAIDLSQRIGRIIMKIIRLKIQYQNDRERIVAGLANSGFPVWVEEKRDGYETTYYVCFEWSEWGSI